MVWNVQLRVPQCFQSLARGDPHTFRSSSTEACTAFCGGGSQPVAVVVVVVVLPPHSLKLRVVKAVRGESDGYFARGLDQAGGKAVIETSHSFVPVHVLGRRDQGGVWPLF